MTVDLLLTNASRILIDRDQEVARGWIAITANRVSSWGQDRKEAPEAHIVRDVGGRVITPGFVNSHHHIFQNLARSFAPVVNAPLFTWSSTLSDLWAQLDEDDIYLSTYVGIAELLLGGCTTSSDDLYVHPRPKFIDAEIRAATEIGFRFFPTRGAMNMSRKDGYIPSDLVVQETGVILEDSERLITSYHDPSPGAMVRVGLSPDTTWSVDDRLIIELVSLAEKHDVRLHTHLSEDRDEYAFCTSVKGCPPVEHFVRLGMASRRTWVAHFAYPTDDEIGQLASSGVSVAHCPSSNMMIGGQTARVQYLRSQGMAVGLGCDGSASTDHASMWQEARMALLLGRFLGGPEAMGARHAIDIATRGSATCLGWEDELGHLRVGALADIVVWDQPEVALAGALSDPIEALLRCAPARAWMSIVNGKVLVDGGELVLPALSEMLKQHRKAAKRIQGLPA